MSLNTTYSLRSSSATPGAASITPATTGRPACLALLGDVTGKRVLDAACGPGLYAAELIGRGARVVGFDHSPRAPLERTCEEIFAAGFLIERLVEPRPVPGAAAIDPAEYERLAREPRGFIAFRLRPRT